MCLRCHWTSVLIALLLCARLLSEVAVKGATLEQNEGIVKAILEDLANGMAEP